jgi:hypothetical protein
MTENYVNIDSDVNVYIRRGMTFEWTWQVYPAAMNYKRIRRYTVQTER